MGQIRAVRPKTSPIFARFEPIALPIPIVPALFKDALIETIISGADVPMDTIVRPITMGEMPKLCAIAALPVTKRSAPQTKPISPNSTAKIARPSVSILALIP